MFKKNFNILLLGLLALTHVDFAGAAITTGLEEEIALTKRDIGFKIKNCGDQFDTYFGSKLSQGNGENEASEVIDEDLSASDICQPNITADVAKFTAKVSKNVIRGIPGLLMQGVKAGASTVVDAFSWCVRPAAPKLTTQQKIMTHFRQTVGRH